tara:strand:+ start:360 stop:719 length:360 start_codon:yes stop_codon:yes gene_type:complete
MDAALVTQWAALRAPDIAAALAEYTAGGARRFAAADARGILTCAQWWGKIETIAAARSGDVLGAVLRLVMLCAAETGVHTLGQDAASVWRDLLERADGGIQYVPDSHPRNRLHPAPQGA